MHKQYFFRVAKTVAPSLQQMMCTLIALAISDKIVEHDLKNRSFHSLNYYCSPCCCSLSYSVFPQLSDGDLRIQNEQCANGGKRVF